MAEPKHPGGRPSKYKPEFVKLAAKACEIGFTDEDLADLFEVSPRTIANWKLNHPEFLQSLKVSKEAADDKVERSLYSRALGYRHEDVDIRVIDGQVVTTPLVKYYPPDTTACIFWLKNRRPEAWRDRPDGESGEGLADALSKLIDKLPG